MGGAGEARTPHFRAIITSTAYHLLRIKKAFSVVGTREGSRGATQVRLMVKQKLA